MTAMKEMQDNDSTKFQANVGSKDDKEEKPIKQTRAAAKAKLDIAIEDDDED
jgi:hypothetical protein